MSKPEIEDLLRESCAVPEDRAFDRRVLDAANELLDARSAASASASDARSSAGSARRWPWIASLAAALLLGALLYQIFRTDGATPAARELQLARGELVLDAQRAPVALTTPLGRVLLAEGRARVELVDGASSAEEREAMRTRFAIGGAALAAAAWLGIEVFEGRAEVEVDGQRVSLAAGERRVLTGDPALVGAASPSDGSAHVARAETAPAESSSANASGTGAGRRGSVRDERGAPIAGASIRSLTAAQATASANFRSATVECEWVNPPAELALSLPARAVANAERALESDARGEFEVPRLTEKGAALAIEAPGFAPLVVFALDPTREEPLSLVMRERVELELAIEDEHEMPLAGPAHRDPFACGDKLQNLVRLCVPLDGGIEAAIPLDERAGGRFILPTSAATAGAMLEIAWVGVQRTRVPIAFDRATPMPLRFTVQSTPHIVGRVLRESGEPFPSASVFLDQRARNGRRHLVETLSDELGWFRLPAREGQKSTRVRAQAANFAADDRQGLKFPTPKLELVLKPLIGAVIAGRVEDSAGKPLAEQKLRLVGEDFAFNGFIDTTSDANGAFRFEALQAGRYGVLWERRQPFVPLRHPDVSLAAGEQKLDVVFTAPIGGRIVVRPLDAQGEPLQKGTVMLHRPRLFDSPEWLGQISLARETDPAEHVFENVPPGRYALSLEPGGQIESFSVKEGETVEVVLGGTGALELRGRVLRGGVALKRTEIAGAPSKGDVLSVREANADAEGRFTLIGIPAGRVLFRVHEIEGDRTWFAAADFHGAEREELALQAPDGVLEIALAEGQAVPADGARARVTIERLDQVDLRRSVPVTYRVVGELELDRDGRGELGSLAAGSYLVEVELDGRTLRGRVELAGARAKVVVE